MPQPQRVTRFAHRLPLFLLAYACGCADQSVTAPASSPSLQTTSVTELADGPWARVVEGETGPGSLYALYVPRDWNGDAVYYAHGIRDASSPVDLRDQDGLYALRDALGARGYAVAYSSFSENGVAVKDGAQRTHQLRGLLAAELSGAPRRNFLVGASLGADAALSLAESFPDQYDGALLACGMVGGTITESQYLGHVRALFDFFYPGVLPGDVVNVPEGTTVTLPQVIAAVAANPMGLFVIASTKQTPLPYVPVGSVTDPSSVAFQTLVGSLYAALSFQVRAGADLLARTHGHTPFGNDDTVYEPSGAPLPGAMVAGALAAANAGVQRYTMEPAARSYLEHYYSPSGALGFPVVTLHNAWDPGVPAFHESVLRQRAIDAGAGANLLQRLAFRYGHCALTTAELLGSFDAMVGWVNSGAKPAS